MRIVTNFPGGGDASWAPFVTHVERGGMGALRYALALFRELRRSDFAIIAESSLDGRLLCVLNAFLGRKPVFLYECLWDQPESWVKRQLHRLYLRLIDPAVIGYVVFSRSDVESYAQAFPVPRSKLVAIPYCTTLEGYAFAEQDEGFIFAGGDSLRDYRQLAEAVRDLPYRVVIATGLADPFGGPCPPNVTAQRVSHEQFRSLMASAAVHVVPLAATSVRSVGHQTYLNGMAMGKPVIVTDTRGTPEYIDHGTDGVLVQPGDHSTLRQWIMDLMDNKELRASMGARAREKAKRFSGSMHLQQVLECGKEAFRRMA